MRVQHRLFAHHTQACTVHHVDPHHIQNLVVAGVSVLVDTAVKRTHRQMRTESLVQMSLYERAAQVLNHEILSLEYAVKRIENKDDWPNFTNWKTEAEIQLSTANALLRGIRHAFAGKGAADNWGKLFAYVDYISALDETVSDTSTSIPGEGTLASDGYNLAERLFKSEGVVKAVEELLKYKSTPPSAALPVHDRGISHARQTPMVVPHATAISIPCSIHGYCIVFVVYHTLWYTM